MRWLFNLFSVPASNRNSPNPISCPSNIPSGSHHFPSISGAQSPGWADVALGCWAGSPASSVLPVAPGRGWLALPLPHPAHVPGGPVPSPALGPEGEDGPGQSPPICLAALHLCGHPGPRGSWLPHSSQKRERFSSSPLLPTLHSTLRGVPSPSQQLPWVSETVPGQGPRRPPSAQLLLPFVQLHQLG